MEDYDVIIIGTGAGGGTMAHRLASTGKRILILERGGFLPRERENWDAHEVFTNGRYRTSEQWIDKDGQSFTPFTHYWVGGNTKMYGAALLRLREADFDEIEHYGGLSPAWPIRYADLAPYYTEAEHLYSVHGERGTDPTEPPALDPYPYGPLPHEPRIQELYDAFVGLGLSPFPLPIAVRLGEDQDTPHAPIRLSNFDGFPDLMEAKADAHVVCIQPALSFPNVTLRTNRYVERLNFNTNGRAVTSVSVRGPQGSEKYRGSIVIVACGAINSAALLLRSTHNKHPNGAGNGSGLVGRHYMAHNNGSLIAISDTPNPSQFQKTFGLTDFYHGADDSDYPLGTVQLMGKTDPDTLRTEIADLLPGASVEDVAGRSIDFWLTAEDLPLRDNRITVDPDGRIRVAYTPNNREAYQRLRTKLVSVLDRCGCQSHLHRATAYAGYDLSVSGVSHQSGTLRFGVDPRTSVLDTNCRAHELDNLYVCDSSFFCSSGAVNPSLTIMANALRVGDHIIDRLT